jgi:hypothetical protein
MLRGVCVQHRPAGLNLRPERRRAHLSFPPG